MGRARSKNGSGLRLTIETAPRSIWFLPMGEVWRVARHGGRVLLARATARAIALPGETLQRGGARHEKRPTARENPVGLVCIAVAQRGRKPVAAEKHYGTAPRGRIQERAMADGLSTLLRVAADGPCD